MNSKHREKEMAYANVTSSAASELSPAEDDKIVDLLNKPFSVRHYGEQNDIVNQQPTLLLVWTKY